MMEKTNLDQLLHVIGDIRAEIIAARAQFAGGQFLVADIVQEQSLHRVDVRPPPTVELILDNVQQSTMKRFDPPQSLQVQPGSPKVRLQPTCNILCFGRVNHSTPVCSVLFCRAFLRSSYE